jgi:hypothetical protein
VNSRILQHSGLRSAVYGLRSTRNGLRSTVYGLRSTVYGLRCTVWGLRPTKNGNCIPHRLLVLKYYDRSLKWPLFPENLRWGGVHNHSLKRQEISKWSWQVTSPVWGKKNEEHSVERLCPPCPDFQILREKRPF